MAPRPRRRPDGRAGDGTPRPIRPDRRAGERIETRRLPRVGRHVDRQGYAAILVQMDEVERLLDRPEARGVSVELFAKTEGIRRTAAMRLVRDHKCSKLLTRT